MSPRFSSLHFGGRAIVAAFACNGSSTLVVPPNTTAGLVALPLCGAAAATASLSVNGKAVPTPEHGDDSLVLRNLGAGRYTFEIKHTESTSTQPTQYAPAPLASYRYRFVGVDHATGGAWRANYGSSGHIMWSWHAATNSGDERSKLPRGISGVSVNTPYTGVTSGCGKACTPNYISPSARTCSHDRRALQPPPATILARLSSRPRSSFIPIFAMLTEN